VLRGKVQEFEFVPFDAGLDVESPAFPEFLRRHVGRFCGHIRRARLWGGCAFPSMHVRHLSVPRVPPRQLSNAVYWTFRKELPFDENETIFDFMLEEEIVEEGVKKLAVTAYTVARSEVESCRSLFDRAGLALEGMATRFFAYRNLFWSGWVGGLDSTAVCLDVGDDSSQVTVFSRKRTAMTRAIKAGLSALTEAADADASSGLGGEEIRSFLLLPSVAETMEPSRRAKIIEAISPPLTRVIRQVERTLESHFIGRAAEHVKRVYLAGRIGSCKPAVDLLASQMGAAMEVINPLDQSKLGRRALGRAETERETASFAGAVGLALSDQDHTPNLLRTHTEKDAERRASGLNTAVVVACSLLVALLLGVFLVEKALIVRGNAEIARLEESMREFNPRLNRGILTAESIQAKKRRIRLDAAARAGTPLAVVADVAERVPAQIRLTRMCVAMEDATEGAAASRQFGSSRGRGVAPAESMVEMDGFVSGPKEGQESQLAAYVLNLGRSPLISAVGTRKVLPGTRDGEDVLFFSVAASIVVTAPDGRAGAKEGRK
jgi:Tfp pilus assembly PilM family ATPase